MVPPDRRPLQSPSRRWHDSQRLFFRRQVNVVKVILENGCCNTWRAVRKNEYVVAPRHGLQRYVHKMEVVRTHQFICDHEKILNNQHTKPSRQGISRQYAPGSFNCQGRSAADLQPDLWTALQSDCRCASVRWNRASPLAAPHLVTTNAVMVVPYVQLTERRLVVEIPPTLQRQLRRHSNVQRLSALRTSQHTTTETMLGRISRRVWTYMPQNHLGK